MPTYSNSKFAPPPATMTQFQTDAKNDSDRHSCKATWSATARANLSILEPASAIFLAALITSEEFFKGPLPLGKFKEWDRRKKSNVGGVAKAEDTHFPLKTELIPVSHKLVQQLICWRINQQHKISHISILMSLMVYYIIEKQKIFVFNRKNRKIFRAVTVGNKTEEGNKQLSLWSVLCFLDLKVATISAFAFVCDVSVLVSTELKFILSLFMPIWVTGVNAK